MRKTRLSPIFLCLLVALPCVLRAEDGQQSGKDRCRSVFLQGEKDAKDGLFEKADGEFDEYRSEVCRQDDPAGEWKKVQNIYFRERHKQQRDEVRLDPVLFAAVMVLIDQGVEKAEIKIQAHDNEEENRYVEAALVAFRGLLDRANNQNGGARDSAIKLKQLSEQSRYQDTKYLYGFLLYELERKGGWKRRFLPFIGVPSGDAREGLELIRSAVRDNNGPFVDDIWFVILGILTDDKSSDKDRESDQKILGYPAEEVWQRLETKYPQNERIVKLAPRFGQISEVK